MKLRFVTYLAPSIPLELYRGIARYLGRVLSVETQLTSDTLQSGPRAADNPFGRGEADIGFLCAPCYVALRQLQPPPVALIAAAPVHDDPRCGGRPVYYSDVVVAAGSPLGRFEDLRGTRWAYNDEYSMSGYYSVLRHLAQLGRPRSFIGSTLRAGSHLRAIDAIVEGAADFAAIDSNALAHLLRIKPTLGDALRIVAQIGPQPVQPVVIRAQLAPSLGHAIAAALRRSHEDPSLTRVFERVGLRTFAPVCDEDYSIRAVFGDIADAHASDPASQLIISGLR